MIQPLSQLKKPCMLYGQQKTCCTEPEKLKQFVANVKVSIYRKMNISYTETLWIYIKC